MKQNMIMIVILVALFFFGILIYDFSDELDQDIVSHDWFRVEKTQMTVITFKDGRFSYYYEETNKPVTLYELCLAYRFNRSINVIKLNCAIKGNKLYISSFDEEELVMTIEGSEKTFYATSEAALAADFRLENDLSPTEFEDLMTIDLSEYSVTNLDEINTLYKGVNPKLVAIVNQSDKIKNALNLKALANLANKSGETILILVLEDLANSELTKLNKLNSGFPTDIKGFNLNTIPVYRVGNKKFSLVTMIDVNTYSEINNYHKF